MKLFADACLDSPAGVTLLGVLEAREREGILGSEPPPDSSPEAVSAAVGAVGAMTLERLCPIAVEAAQAVGPWTAGAPGLVALAYSFAADRRPIAEAIGERFNSDLHAAMDPARQQWWMSANDPVEFGSRGPLFRDFGSVYGYGEFTWAGLWTASEPPEEAHDDLIGAWEIYPGPVSRWLLPVRDGARVYEIHRPEDWVDLVAAYPMRARGPHDGWELPGRGRRRLLAEGSAGGWSIPRRVRRTKAEFPLEVPHQRAAVTKMSAHVLPDWSAVAQSFDAVHLSWAGFITTEGYVSELEDGVVTMLRYWASERTLWLRDVFGEPEPLGAPTLSGRFDEVLGVGVTSDQQRRDTDRALLDSLLGR